MRMHVVLLMICLFVLNGCREDAQLPEGYCDHFDMKGTTLPDMTSILPKCTAANGLSGDNLLCMEMKGQTIDGLKVLGWTGFKDGNGMDCWTIANGKLQLNNFSAFTGTCSFTMPSLPSTDYQKYKSFTLSVVQTVDLSKQLLRQSAAVYLGLAVDTQQVWLSTGTNPHQVTSINIAKAELPNGGSGYQPLFQLTSSVMAGGTAQGWQIESIAVNGSM